MILDPVFERFVNQSPLSVMARATLENVLPAGALDDLFERTAQQGYTRELHFSTIVELMGLVVGGTVPHVQSAYKRLSDQIPVTLKSVYEKLQHIELRVSAELVRFTAARCQPVIQELAGACQPLLPGYRVRIVDGNHLAATQKRLQATRGHSAGPLPGQSLVVLDPALMLITDIIPARMRMPRSAPCWSNSCPWLKQTTSGLRTAIFAPWTFCVALPSVMLPLSYAATAI